MVFQQPLLLKWRRILENVLLPAEILGLPNKESRERARDLLAMVGLAGFETNYPYELSGGMQQRAAIARALVHDPKLILMDEPFGALDALTREKMNLELMRIWQESQKTILFVTHGIQEAVFLGSHVAVMTAARRGMADYISIELAERPRPRHQDPRGFRRVHPPHLPAARYGLGRGGVQAAIPGWLGSSPSLRNGVVSGSEMRSATLRHPRCVGAAALIEIAAFDEARILPSALARLSIQKPQSGLM